MEELWKKHLHDQDNHDCVMTHLEPDILEYEIKWALERLTMNTISGDGGIPVQFSSVHFSSVQSLSRVRLFASPWVAARQASLCITSSPSSVRFMSIKSVMKSSHLPLLLLPPIPPNIRVFFNESTFIMRWPKYWSFSFSIIPFQRIPRADLLQVCYLVYRYS